jgi:hypothetical protein
MRRLTREEATIVLADLWNLAPDTEAGDTITATVAAIYKDEADGDVDWILRQHPEDIDRDSILVRAEYGQPYPCVVVTIKVQP